VALKVLLQEVDPESDEHARFLREARIAAAIKHTNVVNIFDVGVHQGRPYLVMELLEGMDLEAYVKSKGALDERTLMDVIIPIAAALTAVHQAGIVHRDLKPGNIFLARGRNDQIEPKLLDFGISKSSALDQLRLTSTEDLPMGTPFYMSPEATRGLEVTALSDQYALGVVLYECATGVNPFAGASTFSEVVRQAMTGDYPRVATLNPRLSGRMVSIIECAMSRDPVRRFASMRAMGRELLQLAGQRTRITWGLGFNEESDGEQPAKLAAKPRGTANVRSAERRPARRESYVLLIALLGLLAASVGWMRSSGIPWPTAKPQSEVLQSPALARREPSVLEAPAAETRSEETRSEETPAAAPREAEDTLGASTVMASDTHGERVELEAPAPVQRKSHRTRTARARRVAARATPPRPAPEARVLDTGADWAVSSARLSSRANRGPDRGTNNAPILE
jgi:serine/threonine-protein kinase